MELTLSTASDTRGSYGRRWNTPCCPSRKTCPPLENTSVAEIPRTSSTLTPPSSPRTSFGAGPSRNMSPGNSPENRRPGQVPASRNAAPLQRSARQPELLQLKKIGAPVESTSSSVPLGDGGLTCDQPLLESACTSAVLRSKAHKPPSASATGSQYPGRVGSGSKPPSFRLRHGSNAVVGSGYFE